MRSYLLYGNKKSGSMLAAIVRIPSEFSSEDWGYLYDRFETEFGTDFSDASWLDPFDTCSNGVQFTWGLAGPDGAWFRLFQFPGDSNEKIAAAAAELRAKRDVVRLNKMCIAKLVDYQHAVEERLAAT